MSAPQAVYRPRHPQRTGLYQLFERHFDRYVVEYDERFEHREGPLRPVVVRVVSEYLECGRLHGGFARIRCPQCKGAHLLAFSCQTRNFCPSCQAKRGALFAELLVGAVLEDVPHRHVVFTIPKALRQLFARERRLLGLLSRAAHECVQRAMQEVFDDYDLTAGTVASLQTFGSYAANFHPHVHALITDGAFAPDVLLRVDGPASSRSPFAGGARHREAGGFVCVAPAEIERSAGRAAQHRPSESEPTSARWFERDTRSCRRGPAGVVEGPPGAERG